MNARVIKAVIDHFARTQVGHTGGPSTKNNKPPDLFPPARPGLRQTDNRCPPPGAELPVAGFSSSTFAGPSTASAPKEQRWRCCFVASEKGAQSYTDMKLQCRFIFFFQLINQQGKYRFCAEGQKPKQTSRNRQKFSVFHQEHESLLMPLCRSAV